MKARECYRSEPAFFTSLFHSTILIIREKFGYISDSYPLMIAGVVTVSLVSCFDYLHNNQLHP